jgi:multicomponent Na+:H+ antiporter subunit D
MIPVLSLVLVPLGFSIFCILLPRLVAVVPAAVYGATAGWSIWMIYTRQSFQLRLLDTIGVTLLADSAAAYLLLTNAAVSLGVMLHLRPKSYPPFFHALVLMLHGGLNACFLSYDLFNLYVVIELTTIIAFLLVIHPLEDRHIWNGLRYIFISNIGMVFYLIGTIMVYETTGTFAMQELGRAHPAAAALIIGGLLVKGGIFIPGFWLPMAHGEAEAPVSALLSGVVVKIGVLPLLRFAALSESLDRMVRLLGVGSALMGIGLALFQKDIKRLLACSTLSQIGFILAAPPLGAFYAFVHGVAKSSLFLAVSGLPGRGLDRLQSSGVQWQVWSAMLLAALSICGMPLLGGFSAKTAAFSLLLSWQRPFMLAAAVGTAAILSRLIFLRPVSGPLPGGFARDSAMLLTGLLLITGVAAGPYLGNKWLEAIGITAVGWGVHYAGIRRLARIRLPNRWERLEDIIGMTCVVLLALMILGVRP